MSRSSAHAMAALVVAVAGGWASIAGATVMVELSLEDMTRDADIIVRGVVERSGTRMTMRAGERPEPYTLSTLRVQSRLKGDGDGGAVVIRELGGEWQGGGRRIDGTPRYRPGEEVLVFLERDPLQPQYYRTLGMVQGKFVVRRGVGGAPTVVRRSLDAVAFARWVDGEMRVRQGTPDPWMRLDALEERIRDMVSRRSER